MRFIGDLHIHSHYSMATSRDLVPEILELWARTKGITVVGTGDFTHPGWSAELREKLEQAEPGLFRLKGSPAAGAGPPVRFLLTAEISTIYSRDGRTRKVHHVVLAPDFETVKRIQASLGRIGNITSDGRPILGIDSRDLLEIVLEASPRTFFIPAHVWTPWFSPLGSKSGFDSIEECYRDLTPHIFAVETGLSSDPPMNWVCSILDRFTLVSNSDAHSPAKLGREANLFDTDLSYEGIVEALRTADPSRFLGTVEFFPEEGKYHYDGHRKCGVRLDPVEARRAGGLCPVCGKPLTGGVLSRVAELADRDDGAERPRRSPFRCLVPLKELLAEIAGVGAGSKQVARAYERLIASAGSELGLLLEAELGDVERWGDAILREAVGRVRERRVLIEEGFDGEYGRIRVFASDESKEVGASLFHEQSRGARSLAAKRPLISFDLASYRRMRAPAAPAAPQAAEARPEPALLALDPLDGLNEEQRQAASHGEGPQLILAGPGTGKTQTLTRRVARLVASGVGPSEVLVLTFTNRAAAELKERLADLLGAAKARAVRVLTFHAYGLGLLRGRPEAAGRRPGFRVLDEEERERLAGGIDKSALASGAGAAVEEYRRRLERENAFDFDDLIREPRRMLEESPELLAAARSSTRWILVDEYQDVSAAEYALLRLLAPDARSNLCVVGDPNQAIYGFRGADVAFIRRFADDYPGAEVHTLRRSYRCSATILRASSQVIEASRGSLLEGLNEGVRVRIVSAASDAAEAELVARTIERMMGGVGFFSLDSETADGEAASGIGAFSDFAVLCRLGRQMEALEKAFRDHGIPWQRVGEQPFFRQEPARSLLALLRERPAAAGAAALLAEAAEQHPELADEAVLRGLRRLAARCGDDPHVLLDLAALGSAADAYEGKQERVALLTLHAAKGLEFRCVFITGCEDGLLPYSLFEAADPEEERRLFYVGMTRAERYLFLTHAARRSLFGRPWRLPRSPFVASIERELTEQEAAAAPARRAGEDLQLRLF